jgi:hypothetical protein
MLLATYYTQLNPWNTVMLVKLSCTHSTSQGIPLLVYVPKFIPSFTRPYGPFVEPDEFSSCIHTECFKNHFNVVSLSCVWAR